MLPILNALLIISLAILIVLFFVNDDHDLWIWKILVIVVIIMMFLHDKNKNSEIKNEKYNSTKKIIFLHQSNDIYKKIELNDE